MKRKRTPPPAPAPAPEPAAVKEPNRYLDAAAVVLFSLALLTAITVQTGQASILLTAAALLLCLGRGPLRRFRERFCVPVLGLWGYALMNGLAAVYSPFGDSAIQEFYKLAASFSLAAVLLARFDRRHVRGLLWGLAAVSAALGLLCLDAAGNGPLFRAFNSLVEWAGGSYAHIAQDGGSRLLGLYNDPNISGSILGLGALVSLYLAHTEERRPVRCLAFVLLGISAVTFLLSLSRAAILCFGLALVVWLAAEGKDGRLRRFFRMFVSAVVTAGASAAAAPLLGGESPLPLALAAVSGLVMFPLDLLLSDRLAAALAGRGKAVAAGLLVLAVFCGGYAVAALRVTGPHTFSEEVFLYRTVALDAGSYTLSGDWDISEGGWVQFTSRTRNQSLMDVSTFLYKGPYETAAFTLEKPAEVQIAFSGKEGDELRSAVFSDGTEVPLDYALMPESLAFRLQGGLFHGSSFLHRVQFMADALKIFLTSPIYGHGLGATEGLYTSVQPFFYESLYVHNHLLQAMTDMGLFGLASLLCVLGGSLWLILRRLREERDPLAAALLACWVMVNAHSLMEINFSIRAYQCVAWALLLLPVLLWGKPLTAREGAVRACGWGLGAFLWLWLAVFGGLMESHRMVLRDAESFYTDSAVEYLDALRDYARRDVFDNEQWKLNFVATVATRNDSRFNLDRERFVEALRRSGTYTACSGLARYYYLPRGEFEALFACSREGIAQEASTKEAWNLQLDFYRNEVLPAAGTAFMDEFVGGVLALDDYLTEWSEGRLEEIALSEENAAFLEQVRSAHEAGLPADGMYLLLTGAFDAASPAGEAG